MSALAIALIGGASTVLVGFLGWLGVRYTGRTTSLEKATAAWETLYKTQEVRLSALEARTDRLEKANDDLGEENRLFREVVGGIITRLQRTPPDTPETVVSFILDHLPNFGKETV